ncbi:MAG TPA: hypothetical protein VLC98_07985 [Phnomibacter sp.]|nr:hypothetical protein [Phnomibacter sp.]
MNKFRPLSHTFFSRFLLISCLVLGFSLLQPAPVFAQDDSTTVKKPVITVLLPLQLDSLFSYGEYKHGQAIPKATLPYLEFYNGVQMAAEFLRRDGIEAHIQIVDTRKKGSVSASLQISYLKNPSLVIGVAQNTTDLREMAAYADKFSVPFISASYPNDGGLKATDHLYILNSTLKTHCYGVYKYLQRNHSTEPLLLITRKGNVESFLKSTLDEAAANSPSVKLKWKVVTLPDSFNTQQVKALLDSNRKNIIIGATMDMAFSQRLIKTVAAQKPNYETLIVGMPNWDGIKLKGADYKGSEIVFGTPFVSSSANIDLYNEIVKHYSQKQNSKPSDMAIRGYETVYRFAKTLQRWPNSIEFTEHINNDVYQVFCDFNFEPVMDKDNPKQVNYFENKKLYFIKLVDGQLHSIY